MKRFKQLLILTLMLGALAGAYVWFFVYNKPHRNIENATPDYTETALSLYAHYHGGLNSEQKNLDGAVVEFTGIPSKTETGDSLSVVVFVFDEGLFGDEGIRCTLLPSYNELLTTINLNEPITIKGFCSGYNDTDVILVQCSIINR
jgi:hypothetical protein